DAARAELLALIARLNRDASVHGILVQLPLPKSLDAETIINAIDPAKDVDGLHPNNAGRLAGGFVALSPCTPLGCIILTKSVHASLQGMNAIVVGINRLVLADGKTRLVGDVAFAEALEVAGAITPVPGGVGPMTVACLLVNTLRAACAIHGLPKPAV